MKEFVVTITKKKFRDLSEYFIESGLHLRVNYVVSVAKEYEFVTITFTPEKQFPIISEEDEKLIRDFIS